MRPILLSLFGISSIFTYAQGSLPANALLLNAVCEMSVVKSGPYYLLKDAAFTEDDDYFYAGLPNTRGSEDIYTIYRQSKSAANVLPEILIEIPGAAFDLKYFNGSLWVLHSRSLTEINLSTLKTRDLVLSTREKYHKYDHAYDMVFWRGQIYITHGTIGLMIVDPIDLKLVGKIDLGIQESNGHQSLASSMTMISQNSAMIVADGLTLSSGGARPFNGIVEVDLRSGAYRKYPYQNGIVSRYSRLQSDRGFLWINNWGTFHYAAIETMQKRQKAIASWIPTKYTENGIRYSVQLLGDLVISGFDIYACGRRREPHARTRTDEVGILYKIPLAGP